MIDYHVHSNFSADSQSKIDEILFFAKNLNIIITDHYEVVAEDEKFKFNVDVYIEEMKKRELPVGVEFGWDGKSKIDIELKKFDFVILSNHLVYKEESTQKAYEKYLIDLYDFVDKIDDFHVLGHLDFPRRFSKNNEPFSKELYLIIEDIFKLILEKGKTIEVNAAGIFRYGEPNPSIDILKIFKRIGGKYVTIGSDAHKIEDIGRGIGKVIDILKEVGIHYLMVYNEGKYLLKNIKEEIV
ncbi:histidinol phosphate phosphatase [Thermosipho melanesiensis]|uniref:Histidinol-phosphatase n=2 Tax=Thermosipho melanesiensis TaxID=46541 RepID=A6LL46_THEM4|nr:PHP domain-containing protein [Thermosipho melanesiensis]ABR30647.1 histidinol phosphate phosphatase HisJ family [Thermosipho melanesiensis BI429]APT73785.1 histidinol phosphate phosphatase [Thermosipho melanesiensis]OOC35724.1 histidinol phosphate phosphatase [Thermosipho melanesiensis]OOC39023.1 histidinol phosphate phosphatase [Thermosipho melanesiensis]OOC39171.1 histidinol phosphate phosphatase [Thermosipho melanesiensis]